MNPTIEEARELVVKHLSGIESPRSASEILSVLEQSYQKHMDCGCQSCTIDAAMEAETYVVIEEALKMVAESSENGVAGLIYRLHQSRDLAIEDISRIRSEREIKMAVMKKLLSSLIGGGPSRGLPPMPPELQELLMGGGPVRPRPDGPLVQAVEVPEGEEPPEPPPGFIALDGDDALTFLKSAMGGAEMPQELRERLERQSEEARRKAEETEAEAQLEAE